MFLKVMHETNIMPYFYHVLYIVFIRLRFDWFSFNYVISMRLLLQYNDPTGEFAPPAVYLDSSYLDNKVDGDTY